MTRGLRRWLVAVWLCTVLGALAETAAILLFGELTDNALQKGSLGAFWTPAAQWLVLAVVGAGVGYAGGSLAVWVSERFVMRLREQVFDHVQKLPPHFFQRHRQGDLLSRLTGDVEAIEQMAVSGLIGTASALFSAVFYAAAAFWLSWDLAAATFVLAPLFWLAARRFSGRRQVRRARRAGSPTGRSPPSSRSRSATSSSPRRTAARTPSAGGCGRRRPRGSAPPSARPASTRRTANSSRSSRRSASWP